MAEEVTFEHDEHSQCEGCQIHAQHHHVQAVPPVQEVAPQALNPDFLTLIPEESYMKDIKPPLNVSHARVAHKS